MIVASIFLAAMAASAASSGKQLFTAHCAVCHGPAGRGDGTAATFLFPRPRDFSKGLYKIRTTASGDPPTDQDLLDTLARGLPGSAMPSFSYLPEPDQRALVRYVKGLAAPEADITRAPRVIAASKPPPATAETAANGREIYARMGCASCHGESGRGDGPAAAELRDEWELPILAANLARGAFRGGSSVRDIYLRFTTGMNGTPMPSYEDSLAEGERWDLAYYVKSLIRSDRPSFSGQTSMEKIVAARTERPSMTPDPGDALWDKVPVTQVPLMPLWQRADGPDVLRVRARHNGKEIAFLLEWEDPKVDGVMLRPQDFPDAAAVMFSLSEPRGHFSMGDKGRPVNLWQWRMDRQTDLAKYQDVEDAYPAMTVDGYLLDAPGDKRRARGGEGVTPTSAQDPLFLTGYGAGNPMSEIRRRSAVEDLNAEGFGTLTPQAHEGQNVQGQGVWSQGWWKVAFVRTLAGNAEGDAALAPGKSRPVAFAVWDGGAGDRNGKKSVTYWQNLELEK